MHTIGYKKKNGVFQKEFYQQGYIYKNYQNFSKKKGICYIPELSDTKYTYQDFLDICGGNKDMAEFVFETVDWQHPESFVDADLSEIGILPCTQCSYLYDTEKHDFCPQCGKNCLDS